MSEEERRAIAARGGGYQEGKGEITDKAAKDYKDANESIERAGKMGVFQEILGIVMGLVGIKNNPMLAVWLKWLTVLATLINAEFAEAAQKLAETLFSKDSLERMKGMAAMFGKVAEGMGFLIDGLNGIDKAIDSTDARVSVWSGALTNLDYIIDKNINNFAVFSGALGSFVYIMNRAEEVQSRFNNTIEDFIELLEDIDI